MRARHLALAALALDAACGPHIANPTPAPPATPGHVTSNIARADYVGSAACKTCHAKIYAKWQDSPMHLMTIDATPDDIRAPFDGAVLKSGPDSATMTMSHDGRRLMIIDSSKDGQHTFEITRRIGGRTREDFVGRDIDDPSAAERVMPATYVFSTKSWRYKGYSVMVPERPGMRADGPVWAQQCIGCHNTLPYLDLLYDDLYGAGAPGYQGSVSDHLLPKSRLWTVTPSDADTLKRALVDEIAFLGAGRPDVGKLPIKDVLVLATRAVRKDLSGDKLVEVGIGCEVCHGGGREHVANPKVLPTFELASNGVTETPPPGWQGTRAQWINKTCARCHTVLFSHYPWTWEGGGRTDALPGGSSINSGEGRDFQLGGCAEQMSCVACHDPHTKDPPEQLAEMATQSGDTLCTGCHATQASDGHSHHKTVGCIGCHMPKKEMGLSYEMSRYHRIGSATDDDRVLGDRPLECALCHTDQTVAQIVLQMESWYGKKYDMEKLRKLYGPDLKVNALDATLALGKAHEQAAAIGAYAAAKVASAVPAIAGQLTNAYPLVRFFAKHAIEQITGEALPIDVGDPANVVGPEVKKWLAGRSSSP